VRATMGNFNDGDAAAMSSQTIPSPQKQLTSAHRTSTREPGRPRSEAGEGGARKASDTHSLVEFALWLRAQGRPLVAGSLLEIAGTASAELGRGLSAEILGHGEITGTWVATFAPRAEPGAGQTRAGPFARFQLPEVKRKVR